MSSCRRWLCLTRALPASAYLSLLQFVFSLSAHKRRDRCRRLRTRDDVVADICRRLDGLPLAIELAAARLSVSDAAGAVDAAGSPLAAVEERAGQFAGAAEDTAQCHCLGHDLLDAGEQALFRRLSVFAGGWSLDAAEAFAETADLPDSVLDILSALVDQSLVQRIEDINGEPRFTMLETVREYALEQLEASGELNDVRQRHADHFTALAEKAEPQLTSAQRKP